MRDLFECHKCNIAFDEKDTYLQHLMSSHQKTTRRYRLSSSVGKGVIIKDGKYECQFCHKIFEERHRYNSHVGSHVRNSVKRSEMLPGQVTVQKIMESPSRDALSPRVSKMDALIEIAQNSILEASVVRPNDELKCDSTDDKVNVLCNSEIPVATPDHQVKFDCSLSEQECENSTIFKNLDQGLNKHDTECIVLEEINTVSNKIPEILVATPDRQVNFDASLSEQELKNNKINRNLDQGLNKQDGMCMIAEETTKIDTVSNTIDFKMNQGIDATTAIFDKEKSAITSFTYDGKDCVVSATEQIDKSGVYHDKDHDAHPYATPDCKKICDENDKNMVCTSTSDHLKFDAMDKLKESKLESCSGRSTEIDSNVMNETMQQSSKEDELLSRISDSSMPLMQSLSCYPLFYSVSDKV